MATGLPKWRSSYRTPLVAAALGALLAAYQSGPATAERSTFATYGFDQGLLSLEGTSLTQDPAGDILLSTEHGVFTYDGRRFVNLGPEQGLRQGGEVLSIAVTSTGHVVVQYPDEIYVSEKPSDPSHPLTSLFFKPASHPGISFYEDRPHRLAAWGAGFVFLARDDIIHFAMSPRGSFHAESMSYDRAERTSFQGARAVFSVAGHVWITFDDGRICAADPGGVRCYDAADGLTQGPWVDLAAGDDGRILARSDTSVATFDPASHRWSSAVLPDQGARYNAYPSELGLYRTPDGAFITQSVQGLDVLGPQGWHELTVADGAPSGTFVSAMTDRTGQLWFDVLGRGLVRWVGYGLWETLEKSDGLSDGFAWQTARSANGTLWVSTDDGVDEIARQGASSHVSRVFPISSYALAATARGDIWAGYRDKGARVIDPATGSAVVLTMPAVETIVTAPDHVIWFGTTSGLYKVDDSAGPPFHPVLVHPLRTPISSIKPDGQNGIYYLSGGRLHHWHRDGTDVTVSGLWPTGNLDPLVMVIAHDGAFWIGGTGGLFRLLVSDDRVKSYESIPAEDTLTNTTYAMMIDHRGWIWIGTDLGVTVYDGHRWVTADADQGLLSNDINEDGIREDLDGSVWIATSRGISHLRDPASLFVDRPLNVVITKATIGARSAASGLVPYNHDPLMVEFGTPNYGIERSAQFQYRLSDVDAGWVSSSSGIVRYPFVPSGRHVLTVFASDVLTHRRSTPTQLVIDVGFPWWRQWWAEALWISCLLGVLYGGMRLHARALYARQAELRRHIAEATAHIRHQAAHDQLTGLLIRSEVERRLAEKLRGEHLKEELVIALLDIDHFKRINDSYGHLGGDDVLRALGRIITRTLRKDEFAGRYGGEEVLLVLGDLDGCAAERVLSLQHAVGNDTFKTGDKRVRVTCSIGVAWAYPGDSWETLIGRADSALYEAKRGGRDRVVEIPSLGTRISSTR